LNQAETEDTEGVVAIAGAQRFLRSLPPERWALVTSAPRALALARMGAAGLPLPHVLVTSEDVARGKPAPDCFLRAAEALGVAASDCLAWEDTAAGVAAAEAAGAAVVVVGATHAHPLDTRHRVVTGYDGLAATRTEGGLVLEEAH
jgi:sugar-phosphatase